MIVLVGLLLRGGWALLVPNEPLADAVIYKTAALNLVKHGTYAVVPGEPFAYWPVGTSAAYALPLALSDGSNWASTVLNVLVGALIVWSSGLLGGRWHGRACGLVTATVLAVWPSLIAFTTVYQSELFFILAVNATLLAWQPARRSWFLLAVLSGLFVGAACYLRPTALLLPAILAGLSIVQQPSAAVRTVGFAFVCFGVMATAIAPWAARNASVFGEPVLIATNAGPNLWMGNNPQSDGTYMPLPSRVGGMTETDRSALLGAEARAYMLADPVRTASSFVRKLVTTHERETIGITWNRIGIERSLGGQFLTPLKIVCQLFWIGVLTFGLAGACLVVKKAWDARSVGLRASIALLAAPPLALWSYYATVHAVVVAGDRYHYPSNPFIAVYASLFIVHVLAVVRSSRARTV